MLRRLLTTLLGAGLAALVVVSLGGSAQAAGHHAKAPVCAPVTVKDSSKAAMAVFSGVVTDVSKGPRTDGQSGAVYTQTVTVDLVYQGRTRVTTETVTVQTDRNKAACSLGALTVNSEYMFFVTGSGTPWLATGTSGTRLSSPTVQAQVVRLLGEGAAPVPAPPETATFTPVDTSDPTPLSRQAAPGAALMIVGLLGLAVVRFVRTRRA